MRATENEKTGEKMHVYEVGFLIVPTVSEEKVGDEFASIRGIIEAAGASIISEDFPKFRPLAYTMEQVSETKRQKFNEGYFGWIKFELPVASISNIKKDLEKKQTVLRHLIMKTVRENTMYSARTNGATGDKSDVADAGVATGPITAPTESSDNKVVSQKEIDKSIDALVIS